MTTQQQVLVSNQSSISEGKVSEEALKSIREYINTMWDVLTRSHKNLTVAVKDPKTPLSEGEKWPLYISQEAKDKVCSRSGI